MDVVTKGQFEVSTDGLRVLLRLGPVKVRMPPAVARALASNLEAAGLLLEDKEKSDRAQWARERARFVGCKDSYTQKD